MLVLKCGAGIGAYYSQGRGVLRLNGSRSAAQKTLAFVKERLAQGEPWMIQRYVDVTYPLDVCPPWAPHALQPIDAHARFMVYATVDPSRIAADDRRVGQLQQRLEGQRQIGAY
jgi:hypothetical protein